MAESLRVQLLRIQLLRIQIANAGNAEAEAMKREDSYNAYKYRKRAAALCRELRAELAK